MQRTILFLVVIIALVAAAGILLTRSGDTVLNPEDLNDREGDTPEMVYRYINTNEDVIVATAPTPGASVEGSSLVLEGQARGQWYFEATFPVEVYAADGSRLTETFAEAQGEWMTESFVPFKTAPINLGDYEGEATVVLHRSNASGLPEHDARVEYLIEVE